jgi:hypothetical protein
MQSKIREKEEVPITEITSLDEIIQSLGTKLALSWHQVGTKLAPSWKLLEDILETCIDGASVIEMMRKLNLKVMT